MKTKFNSIAFFIFLLTANSIFAADHIILFGVGGLTYDPSSLTVNLGDNIIFRGNFSSHPLSSTSVPQGANSFSNTSGSADFSYTVTVPGNYAYQCDFHAGGGMTGSFTVEDPSGIKLLPITPGAVAVYPTFTTDFVNVDLSALTKSDSRILIEITNLSGQQVISEQKTNLSFTQLSVNSLSNGIYFLTVKQDGLLIANKRIIKG
jgi:plastocyanin